MNKAAATAVIIMRRRVKLQPLFETSIHIRTVQRHTETQKTLMMPLHLKNLPKYFLLVKKPVIRGGQQVNCEVSNWRGFIWSLKV